MTTPDNGNGPGMTGFDEKLAEFWSEDNYPYRAGARWQPDTNEENEMSEATPCRYPDCNTPTNGIFIYCRKHLHEHQGVGMHSDVPGDVIEIQPTKCNPTADPAHICYDCAPADPLHYEVFEAPDPWKNRAKNRAKNMTCQSCMWYVAKEPLPRPNRGEPITREVTKPTLGRCRRRCPTMNGFPAVFPADWCGDHKLDETKL